jgi:hypothetical protein
MEEQLKGVASLSTRTGAAEERMLREDLVREIAARRERGEAPGLSRGSWESIARRYGGRYDASRRPEHDPE